MFATKLISRYASRTAATATVRAVKRRSLIPTRAALTLVSLVQMKNLIGLLHEISLNFQTPSAVKRVKELLGHQQNCVRFFVENIFCHFLKR